MSEDQLDEITQILNNLNIDYWLDSGTLLGIVRDGKILKNEKDLDLSILNQEKSEIRKLEKAMKNCGYSASRIVYDGDTHKIFFRKSGSRTIDLSIFQSTDNLLWRVSRTTVSSGKPPQIKYFYQKSTRYISKIFYTFFVNSQDLNSTLYRKSRSYKLGVMVIPEILIGELTEYNGYCVPKYYRKYLEYRYGSWRSPTDNWNTWRDETCLEFWNYSKKINGESIQKEYSHLKRRWDQTRL